jgi:hypothetical protein
MKKTRSLAVIVALIGVLLFSISCAEKTPDLQFSQPYVSELRGFPLKPTVCWNNYVISKESIYNRATGEVRKGFCEDVECDGDCIFEMNATNVAALYDGRAYFTLRDHHDTYYGYHDILTGENVILLQIGREERLPTCPQFVDGERMYYSRKLLKDGGNPENADDYIAHVCSMPCDGGKEEVLYEMRGNSETLLLINEGIMYSYFESKIWRTDLTTWEQRPLHDLTQSEIDGIGVFCSIGGYLYFNTITDGNKYLVRMDPDTGEWIFVVDIPLTTYLIENDAIYFSPYVGRQINDPALYPPDGEDADYVTYDTTLYACDLEGSNVRAVWTDKSGKLCFVTNYTVVNGVWYGWMMEYNDTTLTWDDAYFAELHFETDEIIPATVVK